MFIAFTPSDQTPIKVYSTHALGEMEGGNAGVRLSGLYRWGDRSEAAAFQSKNLPPHCRWQEEGKACLLLVWGPIVKNSLGTQMFCLWSPSVVWVRTVHPWELKVS